MDGRRGVSERREIRWSDACPTRSGRTEAKQRRGSLRLRQARRSSCPVAAVRTVGPPGKYSALSGDPDDEFISPGLSQRASTTKIRTYSKTLFTLLLRHHTCPIPNYGPSSSLAFDVAWSSTHLHCPPAPFAHSMDCTRTGSLHIPVKGQTTVFDFTIYRLRCPPLIT